MTLRSILPLIMVPVMIALMVVPADAGGPVHGARAAGMNTAFIGVADDPSAIVHNPGGLSQASGTLLYAGLTPVYISSEYTSPTGEEEDTKFNIYGAPHLFLSTDKLRDDVVVGLGIYSPFGIGGREWDADGLTRYVSTKDIIATVAVNPVVAWQVTPYLSVGLGINYLHAIIDGKRKIDQSFAGAADATTSMNADGGGWGINAGLLLRLDESVRLGLAYRSAVDVDFSGTMKIRDIAPPLQPAFGGQTFRTDIHTENRFPETVGMGISWRGGEERLLVDLDVELVRWSSFDEQTIRVTDAVPAAGVVDRTAVLDWDDSWQFKIGCEYRATDRFILRTGYAFVSEVAPELSLGPGNPDADQHNVSLGLGYLAEGWIMDVFYNVGVFETRSVDNDILDGEYQTVIHYLGASVAYHF